MSDTTVSRTIQSIRPEARTKLPEQPGSPFRREQYCADGHVWVGLVTTEPGGASPWHHHGDHTTYAFLLEGEATVEYGEDGKDGVRSAQCVADGSLQIIPPGLPHREINSGSTKNRFLIIRVGAGPAVVPVETP